MRMVTIGCIYAPCYFPIAQSQLRAQLLSQLQKGHIVKLGPPAHDRPSLKRRVLNSLVAEYFSAAKYAYSLSVFREEGGVEGAPLLEEGEVLDLLKLEPGSLLRAAYITAKARHRGGHKRDVNRRKTTAAQQNCTQSDNSMSNVRHPPCHPCVQQLVLLL